MKLIDKDAVVSEIERLKTIYKDDENIHHVAKYNVLVDILSFLNILEVKEVDLEKEIYETSEAFARIIRANLTGIDKDVQYKFEQLYKEITGKKMYQGYSD